MLDLVVARAGRAVGAGQDLVALALGHLVALAGEDRLVERERPCRDHAPVGDDLVAGLQVEGVAHHHLVHRQLGQLAVAPGVGLGRREQRQAVEGALGAHLLEDPDRRVGDDHAAEEGVAGVAEDQHQHQQRAQDEVEHREGVRPDDVPVAAAAARRRPRRRGLEARARLGRGEAEDGHRGPPAGRGPA